MLAAGESYEPIAYRAAPDFRPSISGWSSSPRGRDLSPSAIEAGQPKVRQLGDLARFKSRRDWRGF